MLNEYLLEIIGIIVLLVLAVAFLVFRIKKDKKVKSETSLNEDSSKDSISEEKIDEHENIEIEKEKEPETKPVEEILVEEEKSTKLSIPKRDVPPHEKISKDNFKEFAGIRILIAEDNLINQKVIQGLLADSGIEVVIANDGQEALDILQEDDNFLLILMDAHMPNIDGFEATRTIRKNPKYNHILIVALSGDTATDDIKKMTDSGMDEHLEKPLKMASLYDILYAYTGHIQKLQDNEVLVVMTKELHGDKGLEICGGDETFYHEILNEFITTYKDSAKKLSDLLHAQKFNEASQLLLDIIGVTANIGADPLNKLALDIKLTLQEPEEKIYITLLDEYETHLKRLINDINDYKSA